MILTTRDNRSWEAYLSVDPRIDLINFDVDNVKKIKLKIEEILNQKEVNFVSHNAPYVEIVIILKPYPMFSVESVDGDFVTPVSNTAKQLKDAYYEEMLEFSRKNLNDLKDWAVSELISTCLYQVNKIDRNLRLVEQEIENIQLTNN